jgi:hypothetical protein
MWWLPDMRLIFISSTTKAAGVAESLPLAAVVLLLGFVSANGASFLARHAVRSPRESTADWSVSVASRSDVRCVDHQEIKKA